jgi:hypothetical protein
LHGISATRHDHDWSGAVGADCREERQSIDVRETEIEQHKIWIPGSDLSNRALACADVDRMIPLVLECHLDYMGQSAVVFDDEYNWCDGHLDSLAQSPRFARGTESSSRQTAKQEPVAHQRTDGLRFKGYPHAADGSVTSSDCELHDRMGGAVQIADYSEVRNR